MGSPNKFEVRGIDLLSYRNHPRIVELRVVFLYQLLVKEYNEAFAQSFLKHWCDLHSINSTLIRGLLNQASQIMRLSTVDKVRFRQEAVFMGHIYKESRLVVSEKYLGISSRRLYKEADEFKMEHFLNQEWLNLLSDSVVVCGMKPYLVEASRFVESIAVFKEAI